MTLSYIAAHDRDKKFISTHAPDLLALPFRDACERLQRWEQLGILTRSRAKQLRYALQMNVIARKMRDNEGFRSEAKSI